MERLERLVNLVAALIDTPHPLTRQQIRQRIEGYSDDPEAFRRNFERDKELLRQMGLPLTTEPLDPSHPEDVGYRIPREEYELPDPGLDENELAALRLASAAVQLDGAWGRNATVRALRKLAGAATSPADAVTSPADAVTGPADAVTSPADAVTSPADAVTSPADAVTSPADAVTSPADAVTSPAATTPGGRQDTAGAPGGAETGEPGGAVTGATGLADLPGGDLVAAAFGAIAARRRVRFTYRQEARVVDPWRLSFRRGQWYLAGLDHTRGEERLFRLDRLAGPLTVEGPPGAFARPPQATSGPPPAWRLGDEEELMAELLVDAEQVPWALDALGADAVSSRRSDGSVVFSVGVTDMAAFRSFVLGFLDHAEILGPSALRDDMVEWLARLADPAALSVAPVTSGARGADSLAGSPPPSSPGRSDRG